MSNMLIYDAVRNVPDNAKKPITGGRLNGKTDINPMWRIKALTEQFGMCGFGWKYEILSERLEEGANGEISAFVRINLFVKMNGEWSEAIPGTGGSAFIAKEKSGLYTSDECFKMALTDSISVACKSLGFGADVYWDKDKTKYDVPQQTNNSTPELSEAQVKRAYAIASSAGITNEQVKKGIMMKYNKTSLSDLTKKEYEDLVTSLQAKKAG